MAARSAARIEVTNSEESTWSACRQKWWFSYHELLRPRRRKAALSVGSAVHAGVGAMYLELRARQRALAEKTAGARWSVHVSADECVTLARGGMRKQLEAHLRGLYEQVEQQSEPEKIDELVEESRKVEWEVEGSVERFASLFGPTDGAQYVVLDVEHPFRVPLLAPDGRRTPRAARKGVLDLVLFDPDVRDFVLGEHKTSGADARNAESKLDMDPQTTSYVWVLRQLASQPLVKVLDYWRVHEQLRKLFAGALEAGPVEGPKRCTGRIFYNVVRKSGPKTPSWNKDGTLSAAACDTTRDIYQNLLLEQELHGGPREDGKPRAPKLRTDKQQAMLEALPTRVDKWVARHETVHSLQEQERWLGEAVVKAGEIRRALRGTLPIVRNANHCNMPWSMPCAYRGLCRVDSPQLRQLEYVTVSDPHMEVVESEQERGGEL